jgi:hypothetical protein
LKAIPTCAIKRRIHSKRHALFEQGGIHAQGFRGLDCQLVLRSWIDRRAGSGPDNHRLADARAEKRRKRRGRIGLLRLQLQIDPEEHSRGRDSRGSSWRAGDDQGSHGASPTQKCGNKVAGGLLVVSAKDVEDQSYSNLTLRIIYKTRDGERKSSHVFNLSLIP